MRDKGQFIYLEILFSLFQKGEENIMLVRGFNEIMHVKRFTVWHSVSAEHAKAVTATLGTENQRRITRRTTLSAEVLYYRTSG